MRPLHVLTALTMVALLALGIAPTSATAADHGTVVAAAGQRQWIWCAGTGSPTAVISSGLRADHAMWRKVITPLQRITRTCIYDRPGLGSSPPRQGAQRTDAGEHADELHALLAAAGERGPYLLIAHSYAGLIARAFAASYPQDVSGMLLIDAVFPSIHRTYLPSYRGPWHEGGTTIDMQASEDATRGGPRLGDLPLIVLTAGDGTGTSWADRVWEREQARASRLSSAGQQWHATRSGHVIQQDQPAIVIEAVRLLVTQSRDDAAAHAR
ncbi:MAG: alpha/beta hydrolase [Actinomycetales bacterium]|nr:alpha/beta hydrolase [Actinomycetales bacterium]